MGIVPPTLASFPEKKEVRSLSSSRNSVGFTPITGAICRRIFGAFSGIGHDMTHTQHTEVDRLTHLELMVKLFKAGAVYEGDRHSFPFPPGSEYLAIHKSWPEVKKVLDEYEEYKHYRLAAFGGVIDGVWVL